MCSQHITIFQPGYLIRIFPLLFIYSFEVLFQDVLEKLLEATTYFSCLMYEPNSHREQQNILYLRIQDSEQPDLVEDVPAHGRGVDL